MDREITVEQRNASLQWMLDNSTKGGELHGRAKTTDKRLSMIESEIFIQASGNNEVRKHIARESAKYLIGVNNMENDHADFYAYQAAKIYHQGICDAYQTQQADIRGLVRRPI